MKFKLFLTVLFSSIFCSGYSQTELGNAIRESFSNSFYSTFQGNAKAKMTNDRSLVFSVAAVADNPGDHNKAFVLTTEDAQDFEEFTSSRAEVFITSSQTTAIVLNHDNSKVFILGLDNDDSKNVLKLLERHPLIASSLGTHFLSYGISFLEGSWSLPELEKSTYRNPFNYLASGDVSGRFAPEELGEINGGYLSCDGESCTSGGAGSVECSITEDITVKVGVKQSCTVKCGAGYYACCNSKTIRCYCCKNGR